MEGLTPRRTLHGKPSLQGRQRGPGAGRSVGAHCQLSSVERGSGGDSWADVGSCLREQLPALSNLGLGSICHQETLRSVTPKPAVTLK